MAGRPQKTASEYAIDQVDELISKLWNLHNDYQYDILKSEVKALIYHAETIKRKIPKIETLAMSLGRKFVKITDDGRIEEITFDEGYRKIMGYLQKGENVIDKLNSEAADYRKSWYEFVKWREANSGNTHRQEAPNP